MNEIVSRGIAALILLALMTVIGVRADEPASTSVAAEKYEALVKQFKESGRSPELINEFMALARENPDDPAALSALAWIVVNVREGEQPKTAVRLLVEQHIDDESAKEVCSALIKTPSIAGEELLRGLLDKSPHPSVQATACFYLAEHLREQMRLRDAIAVQPASRRRFEQFYGKAFVAQLVARDLQQMSNETESLYDRVSVEFAAVDEDLTTKARTQLNEIRYLAIGKPAMEIEGEEIYGESLKLSDYRGKVVVLTFWGHW